VERRRERARRGGALGRRRRPQHARDERRRGPQHRDGRRRAGTRGRGRAQPAEEPRPPAALPDEADGPPRRAAGVLPVLRPASGSRRGASAPTDKTLHIWAPKKTTGLTMNTQSMTASSVPSAPVAPEPPPKTRV